ncbi:MAG: HEAT repeat domain-containing protein [Nitrospiria bacterium]
MAPRELIPILIDLHLVGRKTQLYPPTHALIPKAIDGLVKRFETLWVDHAEITIGIGPAHLLYQNEPLDPNHSTLKELTHTLATAHVALITFRRGLDRAALTQLFSWFRAAGGSAEARREQLAALHQSVPSIQIVPVTFKDAVGGAKRSTTWTQLLDALMEAGIEDSRGGSEAESPERLAQLINRGAAADASAGYEQLVLAHLQRLASPNQDSTDPAARGAALPESERRKLATLIDHLDPPVRERLFKLAFAPGGPGPEIVQAALEHLSEPALLEVLYQIQAHDGAISIPTLELLRKFVSLSREQPGLQNPLQAKLDGMELADRHALYAELFQKKSEKNYYPDAYAQTIKDLSGTRPGAGPIPHEPVSDLVDPIGEPEIHSHFITVIGELLYQPTAIPHQPSLMEHLAVALEDPLVNADTACRAFETLKTFRTADPAIEQTFRGMLVRTVGPIVRSLTKLEKARAAAVVEHILSLGVSMAPALLEVLNNSRDMVLRKRLLEILVKIGPPIAPLVVEWLKDSRWYILRNMIFLLGEIRAAEALGRLRPFAGHAHEQVRLETLRALGLIAPLDVVADTLMPCVLDPDERVASCAISIICQRPTPRIAERLWGLLEPSASKVPEGRKLKLIEALARSKDPASRGLLSRLADHRRLTLFGWSKHAALRRAARAALRKHSASGEERRGHAA